MRSLNLISLNNFVSARGAYYSEYGILNACCRFKSYSLLIHAWSNITALKFLIGETFICLCLWLQFIMERNLNINECLILLGNMPNVFCFQYTWIHSGRIKKNISLVSMFINLSFLHCRTSYWWEPGFRELGP